MTTAARSISQPRLIWREKNKNKDSSRRVKPNPIWLVQVLIFFFQVNSEKTFLFCKTWEMELGKPVEFVVLDQKVRLFIVATISMVDVLLLIYEIVHGEFCAIECLNL